MTIVRCRAKDPSTCWKHGTSTVSDQIHDQWQQAKALQEQRERITGFRTSPIANLTSILEDECESNDVRMAALQAVKALSPFWGTFTEQNLSTMFGLQVRS